MAIQRWQAAVLCAGTVVGALSSSCSSGSRPNTTAATAVQPAARNTPILEKTAAIDPVLPVPEVPRNRALKLRVRVTPRYVMQVGSDWRNHFVALLNEANRVLAPVLYAQLELSDADLWHPRMDEADTAALAIDLAFSDSGQGVDWVVGLVGSGPLRDKSNGGDSLDYGGAGLYFSRYLVMRALDDATVRAVIQASIRQSPFAFDQDVLQKAYGLRKDRLKRHMAATIFLHELAHTLGVPHETDPQTMMYPVYNPEWKHYSDAAIELMRISLEHRLRGHAGACASSLIAHLERTSPAWLPAERDAIRAQLRAMPQLCLPRPYPRELPEDDQSVYALALLEQRAWHYENAWRTAQPLFTKYPGVYAVQELRCQLALQKGGAWRDIERECDPLMLLTIKDLQRR